MDRGYQKSCSHLSHPQAALLDRGDRRDLAVQPTASEAGVWDLSSSRYASYNAYRHGALKTIIKLSIFSTILVITNSYASVELLKIGSLFRLKGPKTPAPKVSTAGSPSQGGNCQNLPTLDLLLTFPQDAKSAQKGWWTGGDSEIAALKKDLKNGPCEISARPVTDGFEVRFQYANDGGRRELKVLQYESGDDLVIDHWIADASKAEKVANTASKNSKSKKAKRAEKAETQPVDKPMQMKGAFLNVFDNQAEWDKIIEAKVKAFDLNSPELDRFRWPKGARIPSDQTEYIERKELRIPYFDFPFYDAQLKFAPVTFDFKPFAKEEVLEDQHEASERKVEKILQGMNYVRLMVRKKDWVRAQVALTVLQRSDVQELLPRKNAAWWAMQGLIDMGLAEKNPEFERRALDVWREGLRNTVEVGSADREFIEQMLQESLRRLMSENLEYAAASLITWADKYKWSAKTTERLAYLRGETLLKLGLFDESNKTFDEYFTKNKSRPLNSFQDRRIPLAIAFRLGDIPFLKKDYSKAIERYDYAFKQIPALDKFSFEGMWFPEEIHAFPSVLINRAEAYLKIGEEQNALRDLRAFIFIDPNNPAIGRVLYRIGDILSRLGAPADLVQNAWRECIFRASQTLGGKLCESRRSANEMIGALAANVPRIMGKIQAPMDLQKIAFADKVSSDDLGKFIAIVFADTFLRRNDPIQAMFKLEPARTLEANPYLNAWYTEYFAATFAGFLEGKIGKSQFKEVVAEYEKRAKLYFLEQTRPQVLYRVVKAYDKLGLYAEAQRALNEAKRVKLSIGITAKRPFDVPDEEWNYMDAHLALELLPDNEKDADHAVFNRLTELDPNRLPSIRLWIDYATRIENKKLEKTWWTKLASKTALTWNELRRYVEVLKDEKADKELRQVLESSIGMWLDDKTRPVNTADKKIVKPTDMMLELADIRIDQDKDPTRGIAVYTLLLSLADTEFHASAPKVMVAYRQGLSMKKLGRLADARQSFELAQRLNPDSVWGRLAANAQKEIQAR